MTKTNKKTLEEIIRVDHAGERGAIKIYEGQLLALKTLKQNDFGKFGISRHQENAVGKKNDWNGIMHTSKEHQRSWFQKKNIF